MVALIIFLAACEEEDPHPEQITSEELVNLVTESLAGQEKRPLKTWK